MNADSIRKNIDLLPVEDFLFVDPSINPEQLLIEDRLQEQLILKSSMQALREVAASFQKINALKMNECLGSDAKCTQIYHFQPWANGNFNNWTYKFDSVKNGLNYLAKLRKRTQFILDRRLSHFDFCWNRAQRSEALGNLFVAVTKTANDALEHLDATLSKSTIPRKEALQERVAFEKKLLTSEILPKINRLRQTHLQALDAPLPNAQVNARGAQILRFNNLLQSLMNPKEHYTPSQHYVEFQGLSILAETARPIFNGIFGEPLITDVFKFYKIENHNELSPQDIQALLIGIVANINLIDLENIIRIQDPLLANKLVGTNEAFQQLTHTDLSRILTNIRNVDIGGATCPQDRGYALQLQADQDFLEICAKSFNNYDPKLNFHTTYTRHLRQKFGWSEYLARDIVYALCYVAPRRFRDGVLFPMHDENGNVACKQAHAFMLETLPDGKGYTSDKIPGENGLYAIGVLPALKNGERIDHGSMQIVFRGSFDAASWVRNLYPTQRRRSYIRIPIERWQGATEGPGGLLFQSHREMIVRGVVELKDKLKLSCNTLTLDLIGHSLASTDSMRCCEALTESLSKLPDRAIKALNLYTYNTPGFEWDMAENFINNLAKISNQNPSFNCHLRYFKTDKDAVQKIPGQALCGYRHDQDMPNCLKVTLFKFEPIQDSNSGPGCMNLMWENGSIAGGMELLTDHILKPHTTHNLNGIRDYHPNKPNPFFVPYIVTNDTEGDARLPCLMKDHMLNPNHDVSDESCFRPAGVIVDLNVLNQMLFAQFSLTTYLKEQKLTLEAFLQKNFIR